MTYSEAMDRIAIIEQVSNTLFDRCLSHDTPNESIEAGLIVKIDKQNGYKLTKKGEAYLTKLFKVEMEVTKEDTVRFGKIGDGHVKIPVKTPHDINICVKCKHLLVCRSECFPYISYICNLLTKNTCEYERSEHGSCHFGERFEPKSTPEPSIFDTIETCKMNYEVANGHEPTRVYLGEKQCAMIRIAIATMETVDVKKSHDIRSEVGSLKIYEVNAEDHLAFS